MHSFGAWCFFSNSFQSGGWNLCILVAWQGLPDFHKLPKCILKRWKMVSKSRVLLTLDTHPLGWRGKSFAVGHKLATEVAEKRLHGNYTFLCFNLIYHKTGNLSGRIEANWQHKWHVIIVILWQGADCPSENRVWIDIMSTRKCLQSKALSAQMNLMFYNVCNKIE